MFPVRGDVRLMDGKETLVFSGSQKAIQWLNKIFSTMHERRRSGHLQKYSRRSTSAPSSTLQRSPREEPCPDPSPEWRESTCLELPSTERTLKNSTIRGQSSGPVAGAGIKTRKAKAAVGSPITKAFRERATLSRQRKNLFRGRRAPHSSIRASTISSRAKSCEKVRPPSSSRIPPQTTTCTTQNSKTTLSNLSSTNSAAANVMDLATTRDQSLYGDWTHRTKSRLRPCTAAAHNPDYVSTNTNISRGAAISPIRRRRPLSSQTPSPDATVESNPKEICKESSERMKKASTLPLSPLGRTTRPLVNNDCDISFPVDGRNTSSSAVVLSAAALMRELTSLPAWISSTAVAATPPVLFANDVDCAPAAASRAMAAAG